MRGTSPTARLPLVLGGRLNPAAVALACGAAVLHAVWNRALHGTTDRAATMAVAMATGGTLLLPWAVVAPPRGVEALVALSATAETAYALALVAAYERGALELAYPVGRAAAPLLATLGGWIALREAPRGLDAAGAAALGAGLLLLAERGWRARQLTAFGFALLAGVAIALYTVADAAAVRKVSAPGYLSPVLLLTGLALTAAVRFDAARLRRTLRTGALVGAGTVAAYLLVLAAFRLARVGEVATLRETSVLLVVLLSPARREPRAWLAAGLVLVGAALVAL